MGKGNERDPLRGPIFIEKVFRDSEVPSTEIKISYREVRRPVPIDPTSTIISTPFSEGERQLPNKSSSFKSVEISGVIDETKISNSSGND